MKENDYEKKKNTFREFRKQKKEEIEKAKIEGEI